MKSRKGSSFEREVCKKLSLWYSKGFSQDWFWRTPNSGGRATVASRKRSYKGNYGDIGATCSEGEPLTKLCSFELKRGYPKANPSEMIDDNSGGTWKKFLLQAQSQAKKAGTPWWILITKRDRKEILITADWLFFDKFFGEADYPEHMLTIYSKSQSFRTMKLRDFFAAVKPENMRYENLW